MPPRPDAPVADPVSPPTLDNVVNLLAKIDPAKDTTEGTWKWDGAALESSDEPGCTLKIPYSPPDNYMLTAVVERGVGTHGFTLGLVVGSTACNVQISGEYAGGHTSGVENIDGIGYKTNETAVEGDLLEARGSHTIKCTVRTLPKDEVAVTVHVDGKQITQWQGAASRLSVGAEHCIRLHTFKNVFAVGKLELRPLGAAAVQTSPTRAKPNSDWRFFVGQWDCGKNDVVTLNADFTARKNRPNPLGKWECVNGEARIVWDDEVRTVLRREGKGVKKLSWKPGMSLDSPPWPDWTTPAVKKEGPSATK